MNYSPELPVLIINGNWNYNIFNPEWVGKYLFPSEKINLEYPINFEGSFRFTINDVRLFIVENKLCFTLMKYSEGSIKKIFEIANKVVEYLPHTPVNAMGINFDFEANDNDILAKLFELSDEIKFDNYLPKLTIKEIKRVFKNDNYVVNLTILKDLETSKIKILNNYHFDINNLIDFKTLIDIEKFFEFKVKTLEMLNGIYNLKIENEQ